MYKLPFRYASGAETHRAENNLRSVRSDRRTDSDALKWNCTTRVGNNSQKTQHTPEPLCVAFTTDVSTIAFTTDVSTNYCFVTFTLHRLQQQQ